MNDPTRTGPYDSETAVDSRSEHPATVGRYRVEKLLGAGGFGRVYLAYDDLLQRLVALKVPHPRLVAQPQHVGAYLAEARTVAGLDHPNIVPVYDVGSTEDCPVYVVSKYVDGTDLAARLRRSRVPLPEALELVATVAEALHHAHGQGLVHRDVKPGNILLDKAGKAFVADFGIALRETDRGTGAHYVGTPAYMSPEQALGEGHRVDARSDVFSLGVVFYELLTGRRPFAGATQEELLEQIAGAEARPPRQLDDTIPPAAERVCLKALAKRVSDRYSTAKELADDLRQLLAAPAVSAPAPAGAAAPAPVVEGAGPTPESIVPHVVPKGLRAFDVDDADFFLDLLPGPRDRHGLPEAVRFWKHRVDQADAAETFPVGLLYGPSGCGKSSLVKAGLLPRLGPHVTAVYVEATADLEAALLRRLARKCPGVGGLTLPAAFAALRRGEAGRPGGKVFVVLDQFEQWLHAHPQGGDGELVRALRQCDGGRLQCLVMVRDDFWMMSTRFMRAVEVGVVEGQNAAAVDLFSPRHARKVLTAFGKAYGTLPGRGRDLTPDQTAFLDRAVGELARDGWVTPVRLALFADLVKGRPWTGEALRELGGAVGIGVRFLDESFTAETAPPAFRVHRDAVAGVLGALLPAPGSDLKGSMRSRVELLDASGYGSSPAEFDGLVRVLVSETRLLTPVAAEPADPAAAQCYQLTHDYLVPSVREWLARKQMETRRGRAERRLAERGALWQARPEGRQLPSVAEWLTIRLLTRPRAWTDAQRQIMRAATRKHLAGLAWLAASVLLLGGAAFHLRGRLEEDRAAAQADGLVRRLLDADLAKTPAIVGEIADYRRWADPALREVLADPAARPGHRLRASLGLAPVDPDQADELCERLLEADPNDFPVIRDALAPYCDALVAGLWRQAETGDDPQRRFRAAAALATYDPDGAGWGRVSRWVAGQLVGQPALVLRRWVDALRLVKGRLTPALMEVVGDRSAPAAAAVSASEILGDYAADQPDVLADALAAASPESFAMLFPRLRTMPDRAVRSLSAAYDRLPDGPGPDPNGLAGRRVSLALALLRLGSGDRLWPLLKASPDPRARSYAIDRFARLGCDPSALLARLEVEPDETARAALWLGLGGFDESALPAGRRADLAPRAVDAFRTDGSPAVHAATGWLLARWGKRDLAEAAAPPARGSEPGANRLWYVNGQGQTMVRLAGPVSYLMGAPPGEPGATDHEPQHRAAIPCSFDISMTEVTAGQYERFLRETKRGLKPAGDDQAPPASAEEPVFGVTWYDAAAYCNWLSAEEGILPDQWVYEPNADGKYAEGMKVRAGWRRLRGYRLPTECEWEFACRGGAATSRCYGDADELLPRYAWYAANAAERRAPVATLLPNAFGLFDVHGNVSEWCHDVYGEYGARPPDDRQAETVTSGVLRAVRGGHVLHHARLVRSAKRFGDRPSDAKVAGFRVARGCPPRS